MTTKGRSHPRGRPLFILPQQRNSLATAEPTDRIPQKQDITKTMTTQDPDPEQSATWAYSYPAVLRAHDTLVNREPRWNEVAVDPSHFQREVTCQGLKPSRQEFWRTPLDRSFFFHRLLGDLYHVGAAQGLLPGFLTRQDLCQLLDNNPLAPDVDFYLIVERASGGWKPFLDLIIEKLSFISVVISSDGRALLPPIHDETVQALSTFEFGVLSGTTQTSGDFFSPGDGIVFLYSSSPLPIGSRHNHLRINRGLVETDVFPSIAKHFIMTGEPPKDVVSIDLATLEVEHRVIEPQLFEHAIDLAQSTLDNAASSSERVLIPLSPGPWCVMCQENQICPSSQINEDDGVGF